MQSTRAEYQRIYQYERLWYPKVMSGRKNASLLAGSGWKSASLLLTGSGSKSVFLLFASRKKNASLRMASVAHSTSLLVTGSGP